MNAATKPALPYPALTAKVGKGRRFLVTKGMFFDEVTVNRDCTFGEVVKALGRNAKVVGVFAKTRTDEVVMFGA